MNITTATPVEIDTELARLNAESAALSQQFRDAWEALASVRRGEHVRRMFSGKTEAEIEGMIKNLQTRQAEVEHLAYPLYCEFVQRGGWTRYYLVEDGHLHYDVSSSRCSRIPSTTHYWMTEFSGQDAAKVIALAGERVCTTCFSDAPVVPRPAAGRFMTPSEAERAAYRQQAADARAAKKAAQITTPDGAPLHEAVSSGRGVGDLRDGDQIKTEVAAARRITSDGFNIAYYRDSQLVEEKETVRRCVAALAHRRGVTTEEIRTEFTKKIHAKARRDGYRIYSDWSL